MNGGAVDGLVVVDKPPDWTSHDVVARVRRIAGIRRVGHAGTLDPMATGVLVLGLGRGTRLLGQLTLRDKAYDATIRLGQTTVTDDAQGELTSEASAARVGEDAIRAAVVDLTGALQQVPAAVSAVKVDGERAYRRVRAGERVELAPRAVTVSRFDVLAVRRSGDVVDVDIQVTCSSGTYVRALARDLGAALSVGGHLTVLRRTRVGPYTLDRARPVEALERDLDVLPLAVAVDAAFPRRDLTAEEAGRVSHGAQLPAVGLGPGPVGVFAPDGTVVALVEERAGLARPLAVFW
ncbi:MAG: tRNA pseudouridine(55) synthase TruB [Acidothermales bacterium]|nr:tRNA pseudouridine(55) synthase TruB [Acidothermales bacterium]